MSVERDLEFLYELGCLRFMRRTWQQFLNPDFQNISEHMFRMAWIALIIARHEKGADQEKVLKMALVHDVPESRTGDVNYVAKQYTHRMEEMAIKDMFANTSFNNEYIALWQEFEAEKTLEAKIVQDADNLDPDIELQEQSAKGHGDVVKLWRKNRKAVYEKLHTKTAKQIWKAIEGSNPHSWHLNARNRFNAGDWKADKP